MNGEERRQNKWLLKFLIAHQKRGTMYLSRLMNPIRTIGYMENPAVFIHKFSLIEQNATPLFRLSGNGNLFLMSTSAGMHSKQHGRMLLSSW